MNCLDWEIEIAGDSESEQAREHLRQCAGCREFAAEIASNRQELSALSVDAMAVDALHQRVMAGISDARRRRRSGWIWAAAAAACLAAIAVSLTWLSFPSAPRPKATVLVATPPALAPPEPLQKDRAPQRHAQLPARARRPATSTESLVVKMLTEDPNVVIIWIADQKGD